MAEREQSGGPTEQPRTRGSLRRVVSRPEGKILLAGVACAVAYCVMLGLTWLRSADLGHLLFTMTTTHLFFGRAAAMAWGYSQELSHPVVIVSNMAIETFMVLIFYPLFVFSYGRLVIIGPLQEHMERARKVAEAHHRTIVKFGVPGLLLFVWFPFWMTGPLVGSVIGFLIGLKARVNLPVVLAGTWTAILCWGILLERVNKALERLGHYVPLVFVGLIIMVAVSIRIRYALVHHDHPRGEDAGE
jgi:uncharacterized membrane protein